MTESLVGLSIALAVAWIPILLKFLRAWRMRNNPVSLAIGCVILLSIYSNVLTIAVYAFNSNPTWAAIATHVFNGLVCLNFYFAFFWANHRFPERREKQ